MWVCGLWVCGLWVVVVGFRRRVLERIRGWGWELELELELERERELEWMGKMGKWVDG
jgi:hypothetical protein